MPLPLPPIVEILHSLPRPTPPSPLPSLPIDENKSECKHHQSIYYSRNVRKLIEYMTYLSPLVLLVDWPTLVNLNSNGFSLTSILCQAVAGDVDRAVGIRARLKLEEQEES